MWEHDRHLGTQTPLDQNTIFSKIEQIYSYFVSQEKTI